MLLLIIIKLSALSFGLSYATPTSCQSQMAALNERMNQMISSLYSSSLLSKIPVATSSPASPTAPATDQPAAVSYDPATYSYPYPLPQVIYVSSPPSPIPPVPTAPPTPYYTIEPGSSPVEYSYPSVSNVSPRSPWPYYDYPYPQYPPPVSYPATYRAPYPPPKEYYPEYLPAFPHPYPPPSPAPYPASYAPPYPAIPTPYPQPGSIPYPPPIPYPKYEVMPPKYA